MFDLVEWEMAKRRGKSPLKRPASGDQVRRRRPASGGPDADEDLANNEVVEEEVHHQIEFSTETLQNKLLDKSPESAPLLAGGGGSGQKRIAPASSATDRAARRRRILPPRTPWKTLEQEEERRVEEEELWLMSEEEKATRKMLARSREMYASLPAAEQPDWRSIPAAGQEELRELMRLQFEAHQQQEGCWM